MQYSNAITAVENRRYLVMVYILLIFTLSACSQKSNQNEGVVSDNTFSAPLPEMLMALAIDETTLLVELVVDDGVPQICTNLTVDQANGTFSCSITLPAGSHTFSLAYSIIDPIYNTVLVTTTSNIDVNIIAGQSSSADFSAATLTELDSDNDGITNLAELDAGTNPFGDTCIMDKSLIDRCSLG